MNILVVAGRIALPPWTPGALAARIARTLSERGHAVQVLCQAIEDRTTLFGVDRVIPYESFRSGASEYAAGYPLWTRAQMRHIERHASLSLSRRVGGNVWMPLDATGASFLARARTTGGWVGLTGSSFRHAGVLLDALAQQTLPLPRGDEIRRTLCIGAIAAEAARRFAGGILSEGVVLAPVISSLEPVIAGTGAADRTSVRGVLGVDPNRFALLASFMGGGGPWLRTIMEAIARLNAMERGPMLLVLTNEPFRAHAAALAAGCAAQIRVFGTTMSVPAAVAACDAVADGVPCARGPFESGSCSRFGADAVRLGRPVLAVAGSSGQAAAELSTPEAGQAGLVVGSPTGEEWARAITTAMDRPWLARATRAAERLAGQLEFSRLIDAVEAALHGARC